MDKSTHFGIDRYRRMKERNAGYSRALVRTNLAVQCWIARAGEDWRSESGSPLRRCMLTWLLANHIVQAFYSRTGIDIQPFSCGGMYGYGMSVGIQAESCNRRDIGESAWIACGSVRVDTKVGEEREFCLTDAIIAGEEPLWVVDKGAMLAIGSKWPDRCMGPNCQHRLDSEVYLTIYQIITMLLAMGYVEDAILGTFVDCSDYGDYLGDPKHPLRFASFAGKSKLNFGFIGETAPCYLLGIDTCSHFPNGAAERSNKGCRGFVRGLMNYGWKNKS